jgi:protein-disulfide isomerase-like protein with CxxC motif
MKKLRDRQREQMEGMLLPHQIARLQQVALQTHMKQAGTAGALASDKVAEELGLTNEQIERLKKRSKEINEKLAKEMEALKEKAKNELLKELSLDQQNKLKEMTGDKYEPQSKDWEDRFKDMRRPRVRTKRN